MRTQPPAPARTRDSPPAPLPAADPYTDVRQARSDHFQAVSDYWALTRTPAGNNVMAAYPESGARPDALALNAAYKAVPASWDQAFAGDPQEVTGRFTAWVHAAAALARNLAAEQHRAPAFRQTLDTFISSATRLASRTQATAQDPAAWEHVFADVPGNAPASSPGPEQTATPDPALPGTGDAATADTADTDTEALDLPGAAAARPGTAAGQRPDGAGISGETHAAQQQQRGAGTGHSARQDVTPGDGQDAPDDTETVPAAADGHDEIRRAGHPRGHQVWPATIGGKTSAGAARAIAERPFRSRLGIPLRPGRPPLTAAGPLSRRLPDWTTQCAGSRHSTTSRSRRRARPRARSRIG